MEVVTGPMSTLLPKLGDLLSEEYRLQKSTRGEIMFLKAELERMHAALVEISEAPIDRPLSRLDKLWATDVRELSYDLEDNIDKFLVPIDRAPPKQLHGLRGFIDRSLALLTDRNVNLLTKAKIRREISTDIKDIKTRIKEVSERRDRYKVEISAAKPVGPSVDSLRQSALYRKAAELVGIERKSNDLLRILEGDDEATKEQLKTVSIVGFGGLGKTTLANAVYNKLKGQFDCGAFVSVSLNPSLEKIFKNILHQLDSEEHKNINDATWCTETQLINELRKFLQLRRYFIVIDDISDTKVWETISFALMENKRGSRIIITTRSLDVAKQVGGIYRLEPLSHADSKKLFYQKIFGSEDKCPHYLAGISEKLLKKCGGLPLAIITIASVLANKSEKEDTITNWFMVYESLGSGLQDSTNTVKDGRKILSLSYYDLPSHLKPCLLYLSLFPEDYVINVRDLIWKWTGEGFVHKEQGKTLYEVGEGYIKELVNRSIVQPSYMSHRGETVYCRIHDMFLDLICFLSNEEHFLTRLGGQQPMSLQNNIRRLSLETSYRKQDVQQLATMSSHVRSLTVSSQAFGLVPALPTFSVLRVLDLRSCTDVKNHNCKDIYNLFHLRYLRLCGTSITEVPKDIRNLQFLQVLDIRNNSIENMPSTFNQLQQLLHLHVDSIRLPDEFENLKSLQEVEGFIIIESPSMLHILGRITELRVLGIKFCEWDERYEQPFIQCLGKLINLKSLKLEGQNICQYSRCKNLSPGPQQLWSIDMPKSGIQAVPRWISSLCSLSSLHITLLTLGENDLYVLGSAPCLRYLHIVVLESTKDRDKRLLISSNCPFQCLAELRLQCHGSMEIMFAPGSMQNLKILVLIFWVQLTMDQFGDCNLGLEHLSSLEKVSVQMRGLDYAAADAIKNAVYMNPSKPTLELNEPRTIQEQIKISLSIQKAAIEFRQRYCEQRTRSVQAQTPTEMTLDNS